YLKTNPPRPARAPSPSHTSVCMGVEEGSRGTGWGRDSLPRRGAGGPPHHERSKTPVLSGFLGGPYISFLSCSFHLYTNCIHYKRIHFIKIQSFMDTIL